jgi:hypothetical protein
MPVQANQCVQADHPLRLRCGVTDRTAKPVPIGFGPPGRATGSPLAGRCRRRARNLSGGRTAAHPDVPPWRPPCPHYGSDNPLCMDVSIPLKHPNGFTISEGSPSLPVVPIAADDSSARHDRIWQDIAPLGHCCHCWVCATRRIFSAMADTLTLLLLVSMILAPVGLLAALATRHGCPAPVERAPQPIPLHNRYRGQPIR